MSCPRKTLLGGVTFGQASLSGNDYLRVNMCEEATLVAVKVER